MVPLRIINWCAPWLAAGLWAAELVEVDFCVYGGTSGGVAAAVQAARMGKSAVVVEFGAHVGGLTSGGLGRTDTGNTGTIGGLAREFYQRVGQYYGTGISYTFEPRVAEMIFKQMLQEARVPVYYGQRLAAVWKEGARLTEMRMENGNVFRARMFLDATYEGDLLAMAGVSFTVGRESTNAYGETLNGIRPNTPSHQFAVPIDPYVIPGNPASGLLPYIQPGDGGTPGDGDHRVQAYNFRLCLTKTASNRMDILPPPNYDPAKYELLGRYIQARVTNGHSLTLGSFLNIANMPNGKTDMNNNGAFSTDFIGMNYTYPTNTYAERARMWTEHEHYIRGFLTFLATDSRVPAAVRSEMQSWGLCRDEFQDTGGWPHALYVREARRMVSDYFITQADCAWRRVAPDSVGLASYNMDSHNCQRVVQGGVVRNEGDVQQAPAGPFRISYRAIVPRQVEADNLFATFCLSGSHIAFSSCRMEPVFMITSQSAATAACLAMDDDLPVQELAYEKLSLALLADGQVLTWGNSGAATGIIVDNADTNGVSLQGEWTESTSTAGYWGNNYLHDGNTNKGAKWVTFTPALPSNGVYEIYGRWPAHANRATNAPYEIVHASGTNTVLVNQTINGGQWVLLLATNLNTNTAAVTIRTDGTSRGSANGYVIADAVRFVPVGLPETVVNIVATDPSASEWRTNLGQFTLVRAGDTNLPLPVQLAISGRALNGVDYAPLPSSLVIPAGAVAARLTVTPLPDQEIEPPEDLQVSILPATGYAPGNYASATVILCDAPFRDWQAARFSAAELANPALSGPDADPDGDGLVNYLEYIMGLDPKTPPGAGDLPSAHLSQSVFSLTYSKLKQAPDARLVWEYSDDLITWNPITNIMTPSVLADDGIRQQIKLTESGPVLGRNGRFFRLSVRPEP